MDFLNAVNETLKFSVDWLKKPFAPAYWIAIAAAITGIIVFALAAIAGILGILGLTGGSALPQLARIATINATLGALSLAAFFLLFIVAAILLSAPNLLIYSEALKTQELTARKMKFKDYAKFLFLNIYVAIAALFSIYQPKPLFYLIGLGILAFIAALFAGPIITWGMIAILVIAFIIYIINVIYQGTRLMFTPFYFVSKTESIMEAASMSLKTTHFRVGKLFAIRLVAVLIFSTAVQVAMQIILFPFQALAGFSPLIILLALPFLAVIIVAAILGAAFLESKIFYLAEKDLV